MKLVTLKNVSPGRLNITQVRGLRIEPGATVKVHPATVQHPAVSQYIGKELVLVDGEDTKVEPIAPAPVPETTPEETSTAPEPTAEAVEESTSEETSKETSEETSEETTTPEEPGEEMAGTILRDAYIDAPGVTEDNVDAVMLACPTFEELSKASKVTLLDAGVSTSYTKRLIAWAANK